MAKRRVEYRRTVSFGNFANETVGYSSDVEDHEDATEALRSTIEFVETELAKLAAARDAQEAEEEKMRQADWAAYQAKQNESVAKRRVIHEELVPRAPGDNALIKGPVAPFRWGDGEDAPVDEISDGPF